MSKTQVTQSHLYWSSEKKEIRKLLMDHISHPQWVLTLGGMRLIDAKIFFRAHGFCHIISVEKDPIIWDKQLNESGDLYQGITPLKMTFSNFIKIADSFPPFDLVNLDFNCILSPILERDVENFSKFLKPNSILGLTLVKAHDGLRQIANTYCYKTVCNKRYDFYLRNRIKVISQTVIALSEKNHHLKELEVREYKNTGDKMPMLFLLYKVLD